MGGGAGKKAKLAAGRAAVRWTARAALALALTVALTLTGTDGREAAAQGKDHPQTKLEIVVTYQKTGKPVGNASVYIRFPEKPGSEKLRELDLKTNEDGRVKVPGIPQGRVMIQVVAPLKRTFGKWFEIEEAEKTVEIQLEAPAQWY